MTYKDWLRTSKTLFLSHCRNPRVLDDVYMQPEGSRHWDCISSIYNRKKSFWYKRSFIILRGYTLSTIYIVRNLRRHQVVTLNALRETDTIRWVSRH